MKIPNTPQYQLIENINGVELAVKREDLIHNEISGNKWRKLYYNIEQAKKRGNSTILTFGGSYSNHIHATAFACNKNELKSIGIIRGEEHLPLNKTLQEASSWGMSFHYVDRASYRLKDTFDFKESLREEFGNFYLVPEGGSNFYGTNGCMEILDEKSSIYDYVAIPAGTGCSAAGVIISLKKHQQLLVFPALKGGDFLKEEIKKYMYSVLGDMELVEEKFKQVSLINDYHFGGYAKIKEELICFLSEHFKTHNVKWDLIYNGKMMYGLYDLIKKDFFKPNSKVLAVHTGGLQGIRGLEERFNFSLYK